MPPPLPTESQPLWIDAWKPRYPALAEDRRTDVVVVGAGIAGLTAAVQLARAGVRVIVLEGSIIGCGSTGHTTAKISALQGLKLQKIAREHGEDAAARYVKAQEAGLAWMSERVEERGVDCQFERRTASTYTTDPGLREKVEKEAEIGKRLGLATAFVTETELPFAVAGAVTLEHQAQFDPYPYLLDLAAEVAESPDCSVHEESRVVGFDHFGRRGVTTSAGHVNADHVIVTTLLPVSDQGLFFPRAEPDRSYSIAVSVDGVRPEAMYLSADQPTRSLRTATHDGEEMLLVGGGGHVVGRKSDTLTEYEDLRTWANEHFSVKAVHRRWSAQDYSPIDGLPYVGPCWSPAGGVLVATGFAKWGMANGTAAAMALTDRVLGRRDGPAAAWAGLFDPSRMGLRGLTSAARLNTGVAARLARDWLTPKGTQQPGTSDGEGRGSPVVHRRNGRPVAETTCDGQPCELSLVCPHLGGILQWNEAERSWDCPLHGSRFDEGGEVLVGPAVRRLSAHEKPKTA